MTVLKPLLISPSAGAEYRDGAMAAAMATAAGLGAPGLHAAGPQVATSEEAPARSGAPLRAPVSPRLAACCEIVMGITMGYMLILML